MRMRVNQGRANYQPNSWGEGPRESPQQGFTHYPSEETGAKLRIRAESFADHYSQARQFYISQTKTEQTHIASALIFELSKVETLAIRERVVAHLRNIDETLATQVAEGLRLRTLPERAPAAVSTRTDLAKSPALSINLNGPESFAGRKLGVLVTDGADAQLIDALQSTLDEEEAIVQWVAPMVGGIEDSKGRWLEADEKIDGGPSILFDAVALLLTDEGVEKLTLEPTARDFVADAFAHAKFIGYTSAAERLLQRVVPEKERDAGFIPLKSAQNVKDFVAKCRKLRIWERQARIKQV